MRLFSLRDVGDDARQGDRFACLVTLNLAAGLDPANPAVLLDDTIFRMKVDAGFHGLLDELGNMFPVIGMDDPGVRFQFFSRWLPGVKREETGQVSVGHGTVVDDIPCPDRGGTGGQRRIEAVLCLAEAPASGLDCIPVRLCLHGRGSEERKIRHDAGIFGIEVLGLVAGDDPDRTDGGIAAIERDE